METGVLTVAAILAVAVFCMGAYIMAIDDVEADDTDIVYDETLVTGDKEKYYPVYEEKTYTVTIHYYPGPGSGDSFDSNMEEVAEFPAYMPVSKNEFRAPSGSEFVGWSVSKYDSGPSYLPGDMIEFADQNDIEKRLFAIFMPIIEKEWTEDGVLKNLFKITFVGNGGMDVPQPVYQFSEEDECSIMLPSKFPNFMGVYDFVGWEDKATGEFYMPGEKTKLYLDVGKSEKDLTLYAKWTPRVIGEKTDVTVTYNCGEGRYYIETVAKGSAVPYKVPAMNREGKAFEGWYTAKGSKWDFELMNITQSITLKAHYTPFFHLETDGADVKIVMDRSDVGSITARFSDGSVRVYDTSSTPTYEVGYDKKGTVTVTATVDGESLSASYKYITGSESSLDGNTTLFIVAGAVVLAIVGCGLFWRAKH